MIEPVREPLAIGSVIRNRNNYDYIVIAVDGRYSLLYGDNTYMVAFEMCITPGGYTWMHGTYFGSDFIAAVDHYKERIDNRKDDGN